MPALIASALSEHGLDLQNEDAYCAEEASPYFVVAIAEGLAARGGGELASRTAIDSFLQTIKEARGGAREILMAAVRKADAAVRTLEEGKVSRVQLATTLVAAIIDDRNICTLIDATRKDAFVITATAVQPAADAARSRPVPGSHPASQPGLLRPDLSDMVAHVLGAPYRLKETDILEFVLGDEFLLLGSVPRDSPEDHLSPAINVRRHVLQFVHRCSFRAECFRGIRSRDR